MAPANSPERNRFALIATVLFIGLISLLQPGCDCSSSGSVGTAPVANVFPIQGSDTALVSTDVVVFFGRDMNETTIDETTFTLTESGGSQVAAIVSYDATTRSATLDPVSDLLSGTEYRATVSSAIEDAGGGKPLGSDYVWSFSVSRITELVSSNVSGVAGNVGSELSSIDGSGRYIVFESSATNLIANFVTNGRKHIYRKDTFTGEVLLVSSDNVGLEANNNCFSPRISDDGRFVVFESTATNLDANLNSGGRSQIYLKDMVDGSVDLVSRSVLLEPDNSFSGATNADLSNDGRYIIFQSSDTDLSAINGGGAIQIYFKDMSDESVDILSRTNLNVAGNANSTNPHMSPDGKYVVYESSATNLTGSNSFQHIYLFDTSVTYFIEQVSVDTNNVQATANCNKPSVSDDGSIVVFDTLAVLSVLDNNGTTDVYYRNRTMPLTELVSANPTTQNSGNGASVLAQISGDGKFVAFESIASDLVVEGVFNIRDIFVRDLSQNPNIIINKVNLSQIGSEATINSSNAAISADGRYVSFDSPFNYDITDTNTINDVYRSLNSTF